MIRCKECKYERFDGARESHDDHANSCSRGIALYAVAYEAFTGFSCRNGHGSMHYMTADVGAKLCAVINGIPNYRASYYVGSRSVVVAFNNREAGELRQLANGQIANTRNLSYDVITTLLQNGLM